MIVITVISVDSIVIHAWMQFKRHNWKRRGRVGVLVQDWRRHRLNCWSAAVRGQQCAKISGACQKQGRMPIRVNFSTRPEQPPAYNLKQNYCTLHVPNLTHSYLPLHRVPSFALSFGFSARVNNGERVNDEMMTEGAYVLTMKRNFSLNRFNLSQYPDQRNLVYSDRNKWFVKDLFPWSWLRYKIECIFVET